MNIKKKAQLALSNAFRNAFGGNPDGKGYVKVPQDNLLPNVCLEQFESDFRAADGNELASKFCAVHSSSALAVNCFAWFKNSPASLPILGKSGAKEIIFEKKLKIFSHGTPPNIDVWLEWDSAYVAIESKFLEYFDPKKPAFSPAYESQANISEPCWWSVYEDAKKGRAMHLDRAQLIKHYFGLRNMAKSAGCARNLTLLYLFWEPLNWKNIAACLQHRKEVEEFEARVSDSSISFEWESYSSLWEKWSAVPALAQHAKNLKARYEVSV